MKAKLKESVWGGQMKPAKRKKWPRGWPNLKSQNLKNQNLKQRGSRELHGFPKWRRRRLIQSNTLRMRFYRSLSYSSMWRSKKRQVINACAFIFTVVYSFSYLFTILHLYSFWQVIEISNSNYPVISVLQAAFLNDCLLNMGSTLTDVNSSNMFIQHKHCVLKSVI